MLLFSENPVETHNLCPACHRRTVELDYRGPQYTDTDRRVRRSLHLGPTAPQVARQLYDEVERWTYKPGWKLWIEYSDVGDPFSGPPKHLVKLRVKFKALDSRGSGSMAPVEGTYAVPMAYGNTIGGGLLTEEEMGWFRHWLVDMLLETERHELREWLRRDGELHDDPHRTDKR